MRKGFFSLISLIVFIIGLFVGIKVGLFFEWKKNEYYDRDGLWPMLNAEYNEYIPDKGFVPDEKTALKIAKNIWEPIFGLKHLVWYRYKYRVRLIDDKVWIIEGVSRWGGYGGGPFIRIEKERGKILEVNHT